MSRRHVSVKNRQGIYYSEKADGSRTYEVRYTNSLGKDTFESVPGGLQDALERQADIRVRMGKGEKVAPSRKTLDAVYEEWDKMLDVADSTRQSYAQNYRLHIAPVLGHRKIRSITTDMVALFLRDLPDELSDGTKGLIARVLSMILGFAASSRRGYIPKNPCADLERKERPKSKKLAPRTLGPGEAERLIDACAIPWLKQIVQTALLTGMRKGEIQGLQWEDVDFERGKIRVCHSLSQAGVLGPTKTGVERELDLLPELRTILFGMPTRFKGGYVFQHLNGRPIVTSRLDEAFRAARKKAGLVEKPRPLRFHDLRHTVATHRLQGATFDEAHKIAQELGHSVDELQKTYAHVIDKPTDVVEVSRRLSTIFGGHSRNE